MTASWNKAAIRAWDRARARAAPTMPWLMAAPATSAIGAASARSIFGALWTKTAPARCTRFPSDRSDHDRTARLLARSNHEPLRAFLSLSCACAIERAAKSGTVPPQVLEGDRPHTRLEVI